MVSLPPKLSLKSEKWREAPVTQIQLLREECLAALSNYTREAQKTCELLGDVEGTAPSLDQLLSVSAQTHCEDSELESYLVLRQRLFDAWNGTSSS
jgi:hypothetical protein